MELINNRYRILQTEYTNRLVSCYKVRDLLDNDKVYYMYIVNSQIVPQNIIERGFKRFYKYSSISHPFLVKDIELDMIYSVDRKIVKKVDYYYITEFFEYEMKYIDYAKNQSSESLIEDFCNILKIIDLIHKRGTVYEFLDEKSIYVDKLGHIKLKDILTVFMESGTNHKTWQNDLIYKAPELFIGDKPSIKTDIYSLGAFFEIVIKSRVNKEKLPSGMDKIISKMKAYSSKDRYDSICDIFKDMSLYFERKVDCIFEDKEIYIKQEPDIVGREVVKNSILETLEKIQNNDKGVYIHEIKGSRGSGKTKILRHLRKTLSLKGVDIFASFEEDRPILKNKSMIPIVSKILDEKGYGYISKFDKVKNYLINGGCKTSDFASYAQINSFIKKSIEDEITAIIIDNLKEDDIDSIEILKYMIYSKVENERIILIYSADINSNIDISSKNTFILEDFDIQETSIFIQDILGMRSAPVDLAVRIYKDTFGNPGKIKSAISIILSKKILTMDDMGIWHFDNKLYEELLLDFNQYELDISSLGLNKDQTNILKSISVLKNPSSAEDLALFIRKSFKFTDIISILEDLVKSGLIQRNFDDTGYLYEFADKTLKKTVYESIDNEEKITTHKFLVDYILSMSKDIKGNLLDELVFHLVASKNYGSASIYSGKMAKEYIDSGSKKEGLEYYKDSIYYALLSGKSNLKIISYQKAASAFLKEGRIEEAILFYKKSLNEGVVSKNHKIILRSMNKLADLYTEVNELDKAYIMLNAIEKYLKKHYYKKGELDYILGKVVYLIETQNHDESLKYAEKGIELCKDNYKKHKGSFLFFKGMIYHELGKTYGEIEKFHMKALELFRAIGYFEGIARIYNSLGILYSEYGLDNKKAIEYYSMVRDIAERESLLSRKAVAYANLGEVLAWDLNYEESYKAFQKSLEISSYLKKQNLVFYNYVYMASIMFETFDFEQSMMYLERAKEELRKNENQGVYMLFYYKLLAKVNLYIGDKNTSRYYINKIKTERPYFKGPLAIEVDILEGYLNLDSAPNKSSQNKAIKGIVDSIKNFKDYPVALKKLTDLVMVLKYKKNDKKIVELTRWAIKAYKPTGNKRADNILNYFKAINLDGDEKEKSLREILENISKTYDKRLYWQVSYFLGNYYIENKNYFMGTNYLVEAYVILKEFIVSLNIEVKSENYLGTSVIDILCTLLGISKASDIDEVDSRVLEIRENKEYISDNINSLITKNTLLQDLIENKIFKKLVSANLFEEEKEITTDILIENLQNSNETNIEIMLEHIMRITWADKGAVIIKQDQQFKIISSINYDSVGANLAKIIMQAEGIERELVVSELEYSTKEMYKRLLTGDTKGFICIPIYENNIRPQERERRNIRKKPLAFIYLESKLYLNNFTNKACKGIYKFISLLSVFIENHNLSLKYSIDKLTSAYNRQYFDMHIRSEIESSSIEDKIFSLVMMDIDRFKMTNDTFGHGVGDVILQKFSKLISENIRFKDLFARYGGEEFVLILDGVNKNEALKICNRLREKVQNQVKDPEGKSITVSMGIASYPEQGLWEEELLKKADLALYKSKDDGRNRVSIWNENIDDKEHYHKKEKEVISSILGDNIERSELFITSIEMLKNGAGHEEKITRYLQNVLKYFEAENLMILSYSESIATSMIKVTKQGLFKIKHGFEHLLNIEIADSVYNEEKGVFSADWERVSKIDELTGMPEWDSVLSIPLICSGIKKGVLYITIPLRTKEFNYLDYSVGQIISPIIASLIDSLNNK
ncbi:diguanylate cyclase (GGDEF)-like protein [Acetoanaerobium pronyense]|uniref:Diguanylate cyclase (GGDEF)-like protein n=1 Tax=Acetoanaerobium pronyense TaxID=1482736 RepID=A0ABS4KFQ0_9FIRM|nr:diguanylate cyclase [Acetoanaerobium pronyense]MBP2026589.1 diguanylate cyclase (GGDEF)-like protein [Acetoanaerobium pronyense]